MNKLSFVSQRARNAQRTSIALKSNYNKLIFPQIQYLNKKYFGNFAVGDSTMVKYMRPDRWRIVPFPLAEPYHHSTVGWWGSVVCK